MNELIERIAYIPDNFQIIEEQATKKTLLYKDKKIGCVYTQQERDAFLYGVEMAIELVVDMLEKVNDADEPARIG